MTKTKSKCAVKNNTDGHIEANYQTIIWQGRFIAALIETRDHSVGRHENACELQNKEPKNSKQKGAHSRVSTSHGHASNRGGEVGLERRTKKKYLTHLGLNTLWRNILCFKYKKIADIQAHSAAPSAALRACRSAIFEKSWKIEFWPDSISVFCILLRFLEKT